MEVRLFHGSFYGLQINRLKGAGNPLRTPFLQIPPDHLRVSLTFCFSEINPRGESELSGLFVPAAVLHSPNGGPRGDPSD